MAPPAAPPQEESIAGVPASALPSREGGVDLDAELAAVRAQLADLDLAHKVHQEDLEATRKENEILKGKVRSL